MDKDFIRIDDCKSGDELAPRLVKAGRGHRFYAGVHNATCRTCDQRHPCDSRYICLNVQTYSECEPNRCGGMEFCRNQTIQKKTFPKTTVVMDSTMKRALRLDKDVPMDGKIIEYVGVYTDHAGYEKKKALLKGTNRWYIARAGTKEPLYIDATRFGNNSRFINHSCLPNCRFESWYVDTKPRLVVVANCDLEQGTILSVSYMDPSWNITCLCGACNGNYKIDSSS